MRLFIQAGSNRSRADRAAADRGFSRVLVSRIISTGIGLLLVMLPAVGSWSQSQSLDSVDVGESHSLDSVDVGRSGTPDGDRLADSESLDEVPAASSESLDAVPQTFGTSLDAVPLAESGQPDNTDLVWQPTPCSQMATPRIASPPGSDVAAWRQLLDASQQRVGATKRDVQTATEAFGASLYRGEHLAATRVRLGHERDAARDSYSEARCAMQAAFQAARRAGVEPGVLRQYPGATAY